MPTPTREAGTNLSVLIGTLSRAPEPRTLPSGDELLALEQELEQAVASRLAGAVAKR